LLCRPPFSRPAGGYFHFVFSVIIYPMKAMLGKRFPYFIALLAVQLILILITVVWTFHGSVGFFGSIYDFIARSPGAFSVFDFIWEYAEVFSGVVVLAALALLFFSFKRFRRGSAVDRLHAWARSGVVALAQYRQQTAGDSSAARYFDVKVMIDKLVVNSKLALEDARVLGGEIYTRVRKTVAGLGAVQLKLAGEDPSLFEDLQDLQHEFADVMILAFELVK
jgi:hypothetical protein